MASRKTSVLVHASRQDSPPGNVLGLQRGWKHNILQPFGSHCLSKRIPCTHRHAGSQSRARRHQCSSMGVHLGHARTPVACKPCSSEKGVLPTRPPPLKAPQARPKGRRVRVATGGQFVWRCPLANFLLPEEALVGQSPRCMPLGINLVSLFFTELYINETPKATVGDECYFHVAIAGRLTNTFSTVGA